MAKTKYEVGIEFKGDNGNLKKTIDEVNNKLNNLNNKFSETTKKTSFSLKSIAAGFAELLPALSAAAVVEAIKSITESVTELESRAHRLGMSANELSKWTFAFSEFNVETQDSIDFLKELQKRAVEAATGGGNELTKLLASYGVEAQKFVKLPLVEKIKVVQEILKNTSSEAQRIKIGDLLGGESGVRVLEALQNNVAGLHDSIKGISNDSAASLTKVSRETAAAWNRIYQIGAETVAKLTPVIESLIYVVESAVKGTVGGIEILFDGVIAIISKVGSYVAEFFGKVAGLAEKIPLIGDKFKAVASGANEFAKSLNKIAIEYGGKAVDIMQQFKDEADKNTTSTDNLKNSTNNLADGIKILNEEQRKNIQIQQKQNEIIQAAEKLRQQQKDQAQKLIDSILVEKAQIRRLKETMDKLEEAKKKGLISEADYQEALKRTKKQYDILTNAAAKRTNEMENLAKSAAQQMQSNFETFFFDAMHGKFDNLLNDFVNVIDRMVAKALAADLANALGFGSGGGAGTNLFSSILGTATGGGNIFGSIVSGVGNFIGGLFGGGFANGGDVNSGRSYLVGENGPELFTPKTSGTIIPNNGGKNITINMTINTPDANSFKQNQRQIIADMAAQIQAASGRDL